MQNLIRKNISDSVDIKQKILNDENLIDTIDKIVKKCVECYTNGGKTMICGNGGSAADAQHIAGEFVGRFYFDRPPLPSIALTADTSIITAIGNDHGYDKIFSRQVEAHGNKNDVLFLMSTSGKSPNIIDAAQYAKENNIFTCGFMGGETSPLQNLCDINILIPSKDTPRIQECHLLIGHIICSCVEEKLFGKTMKSS